MDGWYIVSIVPNVEIMREANSIIQKTLFICFLIFVGFLICFLIYLYITRGYQKEIYALAYTDKLTGVRNFMTKGCFKPRTGSRAHSYPSTCSTSRYTTT